VQSPLLRVPGLGGGGSVLLNACLLQGYPGGPEKRKGGASDLNAGCGPRSTIYAAGGWGLLQLRRQEGEIKGGEAGQGRGRFGSNSVRHCRAPTPEGLKNRQVQGPEEREGGERKKGVTPASQSLSGKPLPSVTIIRIGSGESEKAAESK